MPSLRLYCQLFAQRLWVIFANPFTLTLAMLPFLLFSFKFKLFHTSPSRSQSQNHKSENGGSVARISPLVLIGKILVLEIQFQNERASFSREPFAFVVQQISLRSSHQSMRRLFAMKIERHATHVWVDGIVAGLIKRQLNQQHDWINFLFLRAVSPTCRHQLFSIIVYRATCDPMKLAIQSRFCIAHHLSFFHSGFNFY